MLKIDEGRIRAEIETRKPHRIVINAPDGILPRTMDLATRITAESGIETFILADPSYGSCDTGDRDAELLGADLAFNIGHTVLMDRLGKRTVMVDAFDDTSFKPVLEKAESILREFRSIGLCTTSQNLPSLREVQVWLEERGIQAKIGRGRGMLRDGQVFGCEFYPAFDISGEVEAFVLLGQSMFHAIGVAMSTGKRTFMLDPYLNEVTDVSKEAEERWKRSVLTVYKALDAGTFGVIIGLKEGQMLIERSLAIARKLESFGRRTVIIALREVTNDRLMLFPQIDGFIQTACPRISVDGYTFKKPVLSAPQAEALFEVLQGRDPGDFLRRRHWL